MMNAIIIEHLKVSEPPEAWREKLASAKDARVTVRIETERVPGALETAEPFVTDDPAFGMRRDRDDMAEAEADLRKLRAPRFTREQARARCWSIPMC